MDVLDDVQKEHEKEIKKKDKTIAGLRSRIEALEKRNDELDEKRKQALADYYKVATELEEAEGKIKKLTAQANHNYENSSLPSSKCIDRKKITNNRVRTGKRPGAQTGHPHNPPRKRMKPDRIIELPAEKKFQDDPRYVPTGSAVSRQVVGIAVVPVVTEYQTAGFYDKKKDLTWNRQMLELIQEMIHENNIAPAEGIADKKVEEFTEQYDAIVRKAAEEYEDNPPSDYYPDGYNLYQRMVKYKHNHLLFLSNPLVDPDNNLCERKTRVLKGKFNQAISQRSFEHLEYFCECLSVVDHLATNGEDNLYQSIKGIFKRPRPVMPDPEST